MLKDQSGGPENHEGVLVDRKIKVCELSGGCLEHRIQTDLTRDKPEREVDPLAYILPVLKSSSLPCGLVTTGARAVSVVASPQRFRGECVWRHG